MAADSLQTLPDDGRSLLRPSKLQELDRAVIKKGTFWSSEAKQSVVAGDIIRDVIQCDSAELFDSASSRSISAFIGRFGFYLADTAVHDPETFAKGVHWLKGAVSAIKACSFIEENASANEGIEKALKFVSFRCAQALVDETVEHRAYNADRRAHTDLVRAGLDIVVGLVSYPFDKFQSDRSGALAVAYTVIDDAVSNPEGLAQVMKPLENFAFNEVMLAVTDPSFPREHLGNDSHHAPVIALILAAHPHHIIDEDIRPIVDRFALRLNRGAVVDKAFAALIKKFSESPEAVDE